MIVNWNLMEKVGIAVWKFGEHMKKEWFGGYSTDWANGNLKMQRGFCIVKPPRQECQENDTRRK